MLFDVLVRCLECNSNDLTLADNATGANAIVLCVSCGRPVGRYADILKFTADFAASTSKEKSNIAFDVRKGNGFHLDLGWATAIDLPD